MFYSYASVEFDRVILIIVIYFYEFVITHYQIDYKDFRDLKAPNTTLRYLKNKTQ